MKTNWDKVIDNMQSGLVWFVIIVVFVCVATLILFDVLAGAGTMYFLARGNIAVSVVISLATTGLLMALMFIGYNMSSATSKAIKTLGYGLAIVSLFVYFVDVYFDSLTADILRYGMFVTIKNDPNPLIHILYRSLIGGISSIGEGLAMAIIGGMPVLKTLINNAMPNRPATSYQPPVSRYSTDTPLMKGIPRRTAPTTPESLSSFFDRDFMESLEEKE